MNFSRDVAAGNGIFLYLLPHPNFSMIACQGYFEFMAGTRAGTELNAKPTLPIDRNYGI